MFVSFATSGHSENIQNNLICVLMYKGGWNHEVYSYQRLIAKYDMVNMVKGNKSHVKDVEICTPCSCDLKVLNLDANHIKNGYLVTELWAMYQCWKQYITKKIELFLCQYLKTISLTHSPLIMSQISNKIYGTLCQTSKINFPLLFVFSSESCRDSILAVESLTLRSHHHGLQRSTALSHQDDTSDWLEQSIPETSSNSHLEEIG